jgi:hypothetical protein
MDNVQKHNTCINVPSSQTSRFYHTNLNIYIFIHTLFNANDKIKAVCRLWSSGLWHHVILYFYTEDRANSFLLLVTTYRITCCHEPSRLQTKFSLLQKPYVLSLEWPESVYILQGFEPEEWWTNKINLISNSITGCNLYIDLAITALKKW